MSRLAAILGFLVAIAAAAAAALIIFPAPSKTLALAAIVAGERSVLIIGAGIVGAVLALIGSRPGTRALSMLSVLLGLTAIGVALIPPAQALRLAGERRIDLDFSRYLSASVDTEGPIKAEKTVTYATVDGHELGLDVYPPKRAGDPGAGAPAIIVIHGGGWSSGDKGDASKFSHWLAQQGYAVFDIDYRTKPQPNWKSATGDVKCAIGWVKQHATSPEWKVDPKRITLLGRSAGGHLALLAAYTPGDPKLPPSCDAPDTSVESVIDYYGPTELAWDYAHPSNPSVYDSRAKEEGFVGGTPTSQADLYRLLSPALRVTESAPRTLLIHGGRDQFVTKDNSELMGDKLHAAGVRYDMLLIPYAQHAFDFMFGGLSEQIVEKVLLKFLEDRPKTAAATAPAEATPDADSLPEKRARPLDEGAGKDPQ
ncbi:MAG TPA: alpha/beta hydrolase [Polyangia bacterium]|nr:alpha/beta hydrolase [Polyangia bacterium]